MRTGAAPGPVGGPSGPVGAGPQLSTMATWSLVDTPASTITSIDAWTLANGARRTPSASTIRAPGLATSVPCSSTSTPAPTSIDAAPCTTVGGTIHEPAPKRANSPGSGTGRAASHPRIWRSSGSVRRRAPRPITSRTGTRAMPNTTWPLPRRSYAACTASSAWRTAELGMRVWTPRRSRWGLSRSSTRAQPGRARSLSCSVRDCCSQRNPSVRTSTGSRPARCIVSRSVAGV